MRFRRTLDPALTHSADSWQRRASGSAKLTPGQVVRPASAGPADTTSETTGTRPTLSTAPSPRPTVASTASAMLQYSPPATRPRSGFIHTGKMLSFVYDIGDLYKADLTIPGRLQTNHAKGPDNLEPRVRRACRDMFRESCAAAAHHSRISNRPSRSTEVTGCMEEDDLRLIQIIHLAGCGTPLWAMSRAGRTGPMARTGMMNDEVPLWSS
jgi:hypothetical protein